MKEYKCKNKLEFKQQNINSLCVCIYIYIDLCIYTHMYIYICIY